MSITNYTNLKAAAATWVRRGDVSSVIDDAITLAEADMRNGNSLYGVEPLRVQEMESINAIALSSGNAYAALPARCLSLNEAYFDAANPVTIMPPARMREYSQNGGETPLYCFVVGEQIYVSPTPSDDMTLYTRGMIFPQGITSTNATNAILTAYPNIYLQGVLTYVYAFLRNDAEEAKASKRFAGLVRSANISHIKLKLSGVQSPQTPYKRSIP